MRTSRIVGGTVSAPGLVGSFTCKVACFDPFSVAVMVASRESLAVVVMVNDAEIAPLGTTTCDGTATPVVFDESATAAPPAGAAPLNVTVPVALEPPITVLGEMLRLCTERASVAAGFTVSTACREPLSVAVSVTERLDVTAKVCTIIFAVRAPAAIKTLAGSVATLVLLLANATETPLVGAFAESVTVAVEVVPPVTALGFKVSALTETALAAGGFTTSTACTAPFNVALMVACC